METEALLSDIMNLVYHHVGERRHTPVVCNESMEPHTSHYPSQPVEIFFKKPIIFILKRMNVMSDNNVPAWARDYWQTIEELADAPDAEFPSSWQKEKITVLCKQLLASYKKSSKSIENNLADIKKSVDQVKTAISPTPDAEAKYSDITKNSYVPEYSALASEIRVSGIPEYQSCQ